jgi:pimeloyl-ACP methyl ester carboxylesterase
MPETRYARAGDAHIAYQVFGQGETDLVWMPHWATHLEMLWEDPLSAAFFQGLASFSRVILFDKRGVGLSDPVALAPPLTVESWTEDLSAVLDAVGSQRAAVAASDMAGFIAVLFSAIHPDRTTALVLVNATARVRRAPDYPIGLPDHLADAGIAVHLAERVCSSAKPGEVLVTRTVVDLVAGSGITFQDRGEHALKGVPATWQLFAVRS